MVLRERGYFMSNKAENIGKLLPLYEIPKLYPDKYCLVCDVIHDKTDGLNKGILTGVYNRFIDLDKAKQLLPEAQRIMAQWILGEKIERCKSLQNNFRHKLYSAINAARISKRKLAREAGISYNTLVSYLTGYDIKNPFKKLPPIDVVSKMARACDVEVTSLLPEYSFETKKNENDWDEEEIFYDMLRHYFSTAPVKKKKRALQYIRVLLKGENPLEYGQFDEDRNAEEEVQ
jgi:transcriptional regulator with XRE-family HTH domain